MGRYKDLTGKRFGKLIATFDTGEKTNGKNIIWHCVCDCGNELNVREGDLVNHHTQSCGCYKKERTKDIRSINLVGKRFGRLTVQNEVKERKNGHIVWHCLCNCGNDVDVIGYGLTSGETQSCGCYQKQRASESSKKYLFGKIFGRLLVLYDTGKRKDKKPIWRCACECGNEINVLSKYLLNGNTKSCGCLSEFFIASELKKYCTENYNGETEYKILKNPNTNFYLPYDIYILGGQNPEINGIYIEINGEQHYNINHFHELTAKENGTTIEEVFENCKKLDDIKKKFAKENGIYIEIDLRKIKTTEEAILHIEDILNKNQ